MSFKFTNGLVTVMLLAVSPCAAAETPASPGPAFVVGEPTSAVRTLLQPWARPDAPGAAVSVTMDGKIVASVVAGSADLEHAAPIKQTTVFHVASLSKQFTAFAILLLEKDDKLSIDDALSKYIPEAAALGPITLRQLMNHTSGLRDQWTLLSAAGWRSEDLVTDDQVLGLLLDQRGGNFPPGSAYQYTNSGYSLLAEVVRRASGQSLRVFCEDRIFRPLGMSHTHFQDKISDIVPDRALSYTPIGKGYARQVLSYATAGPTGLHTTAEDLSRWALNFETPVVGGQAVVERMKEQGILTSGVVDFYALGQERHPYKGFDTWSHGGRDAGYRSFLLRIPQERFSVSVLSNAADFDTAKIAFAVADIYLSAKPATLTDVGVPTPKMLAAYAGDYELFPGLIFTISTDGRHLFFASLGSREKTEMPALSASAFQLDPKSDIAIEFPSHPDGEAAGFKYRIGLHGALEAKRVSLAPFSPEAISLSDFVGRFYSRELHAEYELKIENKQLVALHPRRPSIPLQPYQKDTFSSPEWFFQRVVFQRDAAGQVTGFLLSGAVAENIAFKREESP